MKTAKQRIIEGAKKSAEISRQKSVKLQNEYNKNPSKCKHCKEFLSYKKRKNKFCNQSCSATYNNKAKGTKTKPCIYCGNSIAVYKNHSFCSRDCFHLHKWEQIKKTIERSGEVNSEYTAKKYLLEKNHECFICKNTKWRGQKIPLILDHIDGHSENNKLNNLRLVCGNCDMQLPTFAGRNFGNGRAYRRKRYSEGKSS